MSADASTLTYALYAVSPSDGSLVRLPVTALGWEENTGELAVRLQATMPDIQTPAGWVSQVCAMPGQVYLFANWGEGPREIVRGTIFDWDWEDSGTPTLTLTAYDNLIYLQKSEDDRTYFSGMGGAGFTQNLTAGAILQDISNAWSLGIQNCARLTTPMPTMVFTGTKLSQMAMELLDRTYWFGGGAWMLKSTQGVISVEPPAANSPLYVLTEDVLESFGDKQSIDNLVTRVNIIALDGSGAIRPGITSPSLAPPIDAQLDGHTEFGVMAAIYRAQLLYGPSQVDVLARAAIANRGQPQRIQHFEAPDLPFLRRGDAIAVHAGTLAGTYIITGISHDADRKRMAITVDTSGDLSDPNVTFTRLSPSETATGRVNPYRAPGGA